MADRTAPDSHLRLEWVYGYRGHQCRKNLYYSNAGELVYFVAGVGVVYNVKEHKQRFFLGHNDDISSLCLHPDGRNVASGQVGKQPYICVWDSGTVETGSLLKGGHEHGVASVSFDRQGNRLVSVGLDQNSMVNIWDWKKGKVLATVRGHSDRVFDMQFSPVAENSLVSCGVKHIKFWKYSGNTLTGKKGVFGKVGEIQTLMCLAFGDGDILYAGTLSGDVYVWKESNLQRVIHAAHVGSIYSLDGNAQQGFVTGGKDGAVKLWDREFKPLTATDLTQSLNGYKGLVVRSVYLKGDRVLVGTQESEIFEIAGGGGDAGKVVCLMHGHAEGEMWALAPHPKKPVFATGSDDKTVRIWNMQTNTLMMKTSVDQSVRSCAFNEDGSHLAIGLLDGSFIVLQTKDLSEVIRVKERKEVLHEMKYSPDGAHLAVGSNDNYVDIYSVKQGYKKVGQCSGNSSFITHLDWSEDSKAIQTNSGAGERLYYRMPAGKQIVAKEEIDKIRWATFTGVLGAEVSGIWEKYTDKTDVNAADAEFHSQTIVTGDDFGLVKLFRFPSLRKGAKFNKYVGHSAHVTNCRFSADKNWVISTGGADHAIFQWQYVVDESKVPPQRNAYVDSNSEDSDSEVSDIGEIDSDLDREKHTNYERAFGKEELQSVKMKKATVDQSARAVDGARKIAPSVGLKLKFVHGYRGFDCRNNLFYLSSGEIVYHIAALGIIYVKERHVQRFYDGHTDDILCLCIHPLKDFIATGQVGKDPALHVWDAQTCKSISIMKGQHTIGICALDFSADGKKLASIGLDDNHLVVVWDWKKGEKLATTRGHKEKIYVVKWCPHDNNKLVTVGDKLIKFWVQAGNGFTSNRGVFGKVAKIDSMLCVSYGKSAEICYSGGSSGSIYVWQGNNLVKTLTAHKGPCFAMHCLDKGFVTGGKDGKISLWDEQFERCLKSYAVNNGALSQGTKGKLLKDNPSIRSAVLGQGHILVGTSNGEVLEITKEGSMSVLVQGHREGELWGLATHPSKLYCATASEDGTVRVWDLSDKHVMVGCKDLTTPACCVAFSPDGKNLAVGLKNGSFVVLKSDSLQEVTKFHHRKEAISDIKFSPDPGKYLAVASHDNFVDIYNVMNSQRVGVCKGASSYITHVDWDVKGKLIMLNSGARELLYYESPRGERQTIKSADALNLNWATWTCVLGPTCEGIWPPATDVTDINATCLSRDKTLLATADDFGLVKLFDYPAKGNGCKFKKYVGHSAHVTNVRWTSRDELLVSVGGADTAILVWEHEKRVCGGESEDSGTDDEEEGYDSDVQREKDVDYVSKFNHDPIRASSLLKPLAESEEAPSTENATSAAVSRIVKKAPKIAHNDIVSALVNKKVTGMDLKLELVLGFNGFDCRNNLHFLNDGADVVYNSAGVGIVLNVASETSRDTRSCRILSSSMALNCYLRLVGHPALKACHIAGASAIVFVDLRAKLAYPRLRGIMAIKGTQSFYTRHTDDIICLGVNEHPKYKNIIATGQIGDRPVICVWDASSLHTVSVLSGSHKVGICVVNFSCSGKFLLSVGLDFTLTVWSWKEGTQLATTLAHTQRIFHAEFRPDSDSQLVTVGVKHIRFLSVTGGSLLNHKPILAPLPDTPTKQKMQTFLSLAFGAEGLTYSGSISGDVYVWKDHTLSRVIQGAHAGPIFTMYTTLQDGLIVTGGKERPGKEGGPVKLWDQEMKRCRAFQLETGQTVDVVKSVSRVKGKILVGTKQSEFIGINEKTGGLKMITGGHGGEGQLWGLAVHPRELKVITSSDDGTVRMWDIKNKTMLQKAHVGPSRSVCLSPDGEIVVVGLNSGGINLLSTSTFKTVTQKRDRGSIVTVVRVSPCGSYLAVGTQEGTIDLYDLKKGSSLPRLGYCSGSQSFVCSLDFSQDSKHLRVGSGARVNRVLEVPTCKEASGNTAEITYATWTSTGGAEVAGIWSGDGADGNTGVQVNCAHVSRGGNVVAAGDDYGLIKLYDFPCRQKNSPCKTFTGHSASVTNLRFTHDDSYLVSVGGEDCWYPCKQLVSQCATPAMRNENAC